MLDKLRQLITPGDIIMYPEPSGKDASLRTYVVIDVLPGLSAEEKANRRWRKPGDDGSVVAYQVELIAEPEGPHGFGTSYRIEVDKHRKRTLGKPEQMLVLRDIIGEVEE